MRVGYPAPLWRVLCAGCLLLALSGAARAQPAAEGYFIDFRARPSTYIGHTFIVYGRLAAGGRALEAHYAGLIPEDNVLQGLFTPIRATVRRYKDDSTLTPTVIYRRSLTAAEYHRVTRTVRAMQASQHAWHAVFMNCNDFGSAIAEALGMWRPPTLLPPSAWVTILKKMNAPGQ